ncbi:cobalt transporter CbiM [Methanobacterium spitsbergense]|uniref:Cobalt transporter CbiM n=1 Tax=Methanobacterium spitsbergense TaxID=2874285 RepID=A0A8T5V1Q0_9EURY|nr:cobalt transporter CbiM [Methanobacterium spitsbergense]MBZ2166889.1 cobalt transporter CbiM [Methanobacterium spitsbergense]
MHIPDGFIPLLQCAIYGIITAIILIISLRWARKNLDEKMVPLMAVLAAGIFAIMSLNIPVPFGTSVHMVGAALVAIIFCAPEAAVIIFTLVLLVQALLIGDGGVTALGANILNMGIVAPFVGFYSFKALRKPLGKVPSIFIASWLSIFMASVMLVIELWFAGKLLTSGLASLFLIIQSLSGVIEGILTVIIILAIEKTRPDLLAWNRIKRDNINKSNVSEEDA